MLLGNFGALEKCYREILKHLQSVVGKFWSTIDSILFVGNWLYYNFDSKINVNISQWSHTLKELTRTVW